MCMAPPATEKIPTWKLRRSRGHAEVMFGRHYWVTLAALMVPKWTGSGVFGQPWWPGRPTGGPRGPAESNGGVRQTLRPVWFGGHVCAKAYELLYIFNMQVRSEKRSGNEARQTLRTVSFRGHGRT